jgi:hypothetical protein
MHDPMDLDIESKSVATYLRRALGASDHAVPINHLVTVLVGDTGDKGQYRLYYISQEALLVTDEGIRLVEDVPALLGKLHSIAKQDDARCSVPVGHLRRAARTGDIAPVGLANATRFQVYPQPDSAG